MLPPMLPRLHAGVRAPHAMALPPLQSLQSLHTGTPRGTLSPPPPPLLPSMVVPVAALALPRHLPDEQLHVKLEQLETPPITKKRSLHEDADETDDMRSSRSRSPDTVDKRARRKEQCRVNQANYRKRKRQHELQLGRAIEMLEKEIEALTTRRQALTSPTQEIGPEHAIASFYLAMQAKDTTAHDTTTAVQSTLLALQSEQFASLDELTQVWRHHQHSFACFRLHVLSTERLEATEYAILKTAAELELSLSDEAPLVCPVQQRFEIDNLTNSVISVTSEVDLVAGAAATARTKTHCTPLTVSRVLEDLLRRHAMQASRRR